MTRSRSLAADSRGGGWASVLATHRTDRFGRRKGGLPGVQEDESNPAVSIKIGLRSVRSFGDQLIMFEMGTRFITNSSFERTCSTP